MEYGVYGDLTIMYPKPYSIYLRGTVEVIKGSGFRAEVRVLRVWVSRAQFVGLRVQLSGTGC